MRECFSWGYTQKLYWIHMASNTDTCIYRICEYIHARTACFSVNVCRRKHWHTIYRISTKYIFIYRNRIHQVYGTKNTLLTAYSLYVFIHGKRIYRVYAAKHWYNFYLKTLRQTWFTSSCTSCAVIYSWFWILSMIMPRSRVSETWMICLHRRSTANNSLVLWANMCVLCVCVCVCMHRLYNPHAYER